MNVAQRTFVITGGGSGLGAATGAMLAQRGANVVLVDRNENSGNEIARQLGRSARFVRADVTNEDEAANAINVAADSFGALHGLVNCAGIAPAEKILGKTGVHRLSSFVEVIQVNLVGTFNMLRLAAQKMAELAIGGLDDFGERGVIINTASVAAFEGQVGQTAYAASKGGVVALTLPAARELARDGIRVVGIAPGIMETPMLLAMPEPVRESLARTVPFPPRLGTGSDFAALVLHVIENRYINGEVIRLDGALRMAVR